MAVYGVGDRGGRLRRETGDWGQERLTTDLIRNVNG